MTQVNEAPVPAAPDADVPMVTVRRKSRPRLRLPVCADEESDGAQVDEEFLAGVRLWGPSPRGDL